MKFRDIFRHAAMTAACTAALSVAGTASGANWLMLQGTEAPGASPPAKVWGWIQADYEKDYSKPNAAGGYVAPKLLGPDLNSQAAFNVQRARIGVRGTAFPIDDGHVNYFIMAEFGNNATTHNGATYTFGKLTDASITLNYLPGARVRAGLFKYPGAEEGMQGIATMDYIDFTEITNGELLERFPNPGYQAPSTNIAPQTLSQLQNGSSLNAFNTPVGAFRDVGVQLFDAFELSNDWELSYAAMVGQGSGIEFNNVDGKYDTYLYLSLEKKFGTGKGPFAEGLKFFAWSQNGQRLVPDAASNPVFYKRDRSGVGMKYLQKPFRVTAEYIKADGMIWIGPDKPSFVLDPPDYNVNSLNAQANGYYVEGGWYIPSTKWELDARYDTMDRLLNRPDEHRFTKETLGMQYHFTPRDKVTVNYEFRQFKCIASSVACTNVNKNLSGVGNKLGVQLTTIF